MVEVVVHHGHHWCHEVRMVRIRITRMMRPTWTTQMPYVRSVGLAPNKPNKPAEVVLCHGGRGVRLGLCWWWW